MCYASLVSPSVTLHEALCERAYLHAEHCGIIMQAGELVEVSNMNADNPLAWLVRVTDAGMDSVQVMPSK